VPFGIGREALDTVLVEHPITINVARAEFQIKLLPIPGRLLISAAAMRQVVTDALKPMRGLADITALTTTEVER
jgi:hypothetical protein